MRKVKLLLPLLLGPMLSKRKAVEHRIRRAAAQEISLAMASSELLMLLGFFFCSSSAPFNDDDDWSWAWAAWRRLTRGGALGVRTQGEQKMLDDVYVNIISAASECFIWPPLFSWVRRVTGIPNGAQDS